MIVNGRERLACKTLVREVADRDGATVRIEPLKHLPLLRDLMVDQDEFFARRRKVKPFLINPQKVEEKERLQSPEQRVLFDSRDSGFEERLPVLDHADGVWACENHFQCTRVCPRGIKITKNINLTKRKITQARQDEGGKA